MIDHHRAAIGHVAFGVIRVGSEMSVAGLLYSQLQAKHCTGERWTSIRVTSVLDLASGASWITKAICQGYLANDASLHKTRSQQAGHPVDVG
jgi:hypothetical protein